MNLSDLIKPESVLCNVDAGSKKHAIEILGKLLSRSDDSLSAEEIFSSLIDRERLGCTALGNGAAIPHARLAGVAEPVAAFVSLSDAVDFDTPDGEPVDLIFGLIVPEDTDETDVRDFETIMHRFSDPGFQESLRAARSSNDLFECLNENFAVVAEPENSDVRDQDQALR